jgi:hypothetical protein
LNPLAIFNNVVATNDEIGYSADPSSGGVSGWTKGPAIYVNDPTDSYPAMFGFQNKANYTDGTITALRDLDVSGSLNVTGTITANSASFNYLETIYETASVIYSSGSNQFGDELSDKQILSGSVQVQGELLVNGVAVVTGSVNRDGLITTGSLTSNQEINGGLTLDTTKNQIVLVSNVAPGGNNILGADFSNFDSFIFDEWNNNGFSGVTVNGPGVTNATITGVNFGTYLELTLSAGTTTSGATYTFTGLMYDIFYVTGSVKSNGVISDRGFVATTGYGYVLRGQNKDEGIQFGDYNILTSTGDTTNVFTSFRIFTEEGYSAGLTYIGMAANSYSPEYPGVMTPMILGNGSNPSGSDTAIAFTPNGNMDIWKKSNFKYGVDITGSLRVNGDTTLSGSLIGNTLNGGLITIQSEANRSGSVQFNITGSSPISQSNVIMGGSGSPNAANLTGSIVISGSNNILTNATRLDTLGPQGRYGYINGNGNILSTIPTLNTGSILRPIMNNNTIQGGNMTLFFTTSSLGGGEPQITNNIINGGTFNLVLASGSMNAQNNNISNVITHNANTTPFTVRPTFTNNIVMNSITYNHISSSINSVNNILAGGLTINNTYYHTGSANNTTFNRNLILGQNQTINYGGNPATNVVRSVGDTLIGGINNSVSLEITGSNNTSLYSTLIYGNGLIVTGSNTGISAGGSTFVGRWNATGSLQESSNEAVFVVGTGTSATTRRNALHIDSNNNSNFTGSVNISGSLTINGTSYTAATSGTSGTSGSNGTDGTSGSSGISNSFFNYQAKTSITSGDPLSGHIIWNNATQSGSTEINVSDLDQQGDNLDIFLGNLKSGSRITLQDKSVQGNIQVWDIGTSTDNTSYWSYPVTLVSSTYEFNNNDQILFIITTTPSGTSGTSGTSGSSGSDGTSGTSGSSGSDGTSGTSGSNGTDGTSGTSGSSGSSGSDGTSGTSGSNGTSGSSGTSGADGIGLSSKAGNVNSTSGWVIYPLGGGSDGLYYDVVFAEPFGSSNYTVAYNVLSTGGIFGGITLSGSTISSTGFRFVTQGTTFTSNPDVDWTAISWGETGVPGTSGTSGSSGSDGTSGTSGGTGTSGTSGSSGTSPSISGAGLITTGSIATIQSITGSLIISGSQSITGSLASSGSNVLRGVNQITGSNTLDGITRVTGSLLISNPAIVVMSGSISMSGSNTLRGATTITGSNTLQGSTTITGSLITQGATRITGSLLFDPNSENITGSLKISGSVYGVVNSLTITSNTASLNLNNGNFFTLSLPTGVDTFVSASNITPGQTINLVVSNGGTGTITFSNNIKQPSGSFYVPTTGATAVDVVSLISVDSNNLYMNNVKNFI